MPALRLRVLLPAAAVALAAAATAQVPARALDERPAGAGEWGFRPAHGTAAETNPPAFVWRPQRGAHRYRWQLARDPAFSEVAAERDLPWNVCCPPAALQPGTWHWRFRAGAADGTWTGWSTTRSFRLTEHTPRFALPAREELLRAVPGSHPRLFVRPEDRAALQKAARGDLADRWRSLLAQCDRILADPPSTKEPPKYPPSTERKSEEWRAIWWGNRRLTIAVLQSAHTLAFTAWLDGTDATAPHRKLARRLLLDAARWDPKGATGYRYNDEAGMPYAYHFARTYTFLHDALDEGERAGCRQVMAARGGEMYRHLCPGHLWRPYSSHSNRAWHFLGELGIAFLDEIPEAADWLHFATRVFGAAYPVWSDDDGGWHEGLAYYRSYLGRFTWWADAMQSALGIDAYDKPFFARVGDFPLYLQPPGTRGGGFGDLCGRLASKGNVALLQTFALQAGNPYWQWYVDAHGGAPPDVGAIGFLRAARGRVEARPPDDLPSSRCFSGTGIAVLNTNLRDARENVQVIFKSSPFGTQSHGYEAQNSFLLYAFGERLLIRSGRRDVYGSDHHRDWMWSTRSTNSITIGGHDQVRHSPAATGEIVGFATSPAIDYVAGEAGAAYGSHAERFTRHILFVKPELIVVFDRVAAPAPTTYQWWLHAETPWQPAGPRTFAIRTGKAACRVRWLTPDDLDVDTTDRFDPPPRPRVKLVQHHLTATTAEPSRAVCFVAAIRPYLAGAEPSGAEILQAVDNGYLLRAELSDGEVTVLLRAGEDGEVTGGGLWTDGDVAALWRSEAEERARFVTEGARIRTAR